jgi:hypothetical protein
MSLKDGAGWNGSSRWAGVGGVPAAQQEKRWSRAGATVFAFDSGLALPGETAGVGVAAELPADG